MLDSNWCASEIIFFKTRSSKVVLQQHFKEAVIAALATQAVAFLGGATQIWDFKLATSMFQDLVHA
jgi:hypothetical protein